jgi:hypothetical protein
VLNDPRASLAIDAMMDRAIEQIRAGQTIGGEGLSR